MNIPIILAPKRIYNFASSTMIAYLLYFAIFHSNGNYIFFTCHSLLCLWKCCPI